MDQDQATTAAAVQQEQEQVQETQETQAIAPQAPILVLGASGVLGRAVYTTLRQAEHAVTGTCHSRLSNDDPTLQLVDLIADAPTNSLSSEDELPHLTSLLDRIQPRVIINCVEKRQGLDWEGSYPDTTANANQVAERLNVRLPRAIARWCQKPQEFVKPVLHIHISTDQVFDGTSPPYQPHALPNPVNAYGQSKLRAERALLELMSPEQLVIVRVPVLYVVNLPFPFLLSYFFSFPFYSASFNSSRSFPREDRGTG